MIRGPLLRLVLLVSCAHALVHMYELALPSVELAVAADYVPGDAALGKQTTGLLSTCWRLPWGLGALLAGWLVDRWGSRRMLAVYLLGSAATCVAIAWRPPLPGLFALMFAMGCCACIYHPAGLALLSHATPSRQRPFVLGLHGIFGSAGIGAAPFLAGLLFRWGVPWPRYYLVLAVPGGLLGLFFVLLARREARRPVDRDTVPEDDRHAGDWLAFFTLTVLALCQGFVYSAVLSFLPRYLGTDGGETTVASAASLGSLWTGAVLFAGCLGQFAAGTFAREESLERQLTLITLGNVPFLLWMTIAQGGERILAAALFALVHFMHQPIYNSLIAKYTPRHRRSVCYGFSFAMGLGMGSFGATFAGYSPDHGTTYGVLAGVAVLAALLGGRLWATHPNMNLPAKR